MALGPAIRRLITARCAIAEVIFKDTTAIEAIAGRLPTISRQFHCWDSRREQAPLSGDILAGFNM